MARRFCRIGWYGTRVRLVAQAMLKIVKLDIAGLRAAYDGRTAA
jgi:hypothetical protein